MCVEAWAQRASRSPCSLRPGSPSPWHDGCLCLSVCQVCKEQGRNSGSQHGRSNHEHERSSLSPAVAKEGGCPCRTASGACKTSGNQNAGTSTAAANRTMVRLAQESAQHVAARRQRSAGQDVQARQGLQIALVPT